MWLSNLRTIVFGTRSRRRRPARRSGARLQVGQLEGRTLLSTVSIGSTGDLFYTAGAGVANNLVISWDGSHTYTFTDTAEPIYVDNFFADLQCSGSGTNTLTVDSNSVAYDAVDLKGNDITAWTAGVTAMHLDLGDQDNQLSLGGTGVRMFIDNTEGGFDRVVLGSQGASGGDTLANIRGNVSVTNPWGATELILDDFDDSSGHDVSMYDGSITGLAPATISWTPNAPGSETGGVNSLRVYGSSPINSSPSDSQYNSWDINGTSDFWGETYLLTASGSSNVDSLVNWVTVQSTSGPLSIDSGDYPQKVAIGTTSGSMANIHGSVGVFDSTLGGVTTLYLNDSGDTTGHSVSMYDGKITGLSPAPIYWSPESTAGLYVSGSGAATPVGPDATNIWNIYGTSDFSKFSNSSSLPPPGEVPGETTIVCDGSNDVVNVEATGGMLEINTENFTTGGDTVTVGSGGTLANIHGFVFVDSSTLSGYPKLIVDDSGDTASKTATLTVAPWEYGLQVASLTGLAPAPIEWIPFSSSHGGVVGVSIDCGRGNDTVTVATPVPAMPMPLTLNGGGGTDTLIGPSANETWNITGSNAGNGAGVTFSAFENLTGGSANDTFQFSNGARFTGAIRGGGGTNTLGYAAYSTGVTVNLTAGTATGTGGVANIQNVVGSPANDSITGNSASNVLAGNGGNDVLNGGPGGNDTFVLGATQGAGTSVAGDGTGDTLKGANVANTWNVTGANAGNVNGIAFTGIASLTGGTAADTFKFTAAGGVSGKVYGGGGIDALDYSGDGGLAVMVNLATAAATRTGGFSAITRLVGSSAADTLIGPNLASTWTITGANSGTVGGFTFSAVEKLTGGSGNDNFKFTTGSVSGLVDGGAGTDALDYSADGGVAATVNLATAAATRTGGFARIEKLVGSSSTADTLIGPNASTPTIWKITANNAGTVGSVTFSAVEDLTGGSGVDEFVFGAGMTVSGKINGGSGSANWLDYAAYTTAVAVDLAANTATGVAGGIANIRNVRGGSGNDTLKGNAPGNILIGGGGGDAITGGGGRSILIGGTGNDTVKGGSANDIIIGGSTSYDGSGDANDLALEAILAEWQSGDAYATRVSKIKAGVGPTLAKLVWGTTVHDDLNASTLTGGAGTDWFFKGASDSITDLAVGEQVN